MLKFDCTGTEKLFMRFIASHSNRLTPATTRPNRGGRREAGLTFWDVLISMVIVALVFGSIINGYLAGAKKAQWSGYSLAAQSLTLHAVEQARSATWDGNLNVQITNMTLQNKTFTNTSANTWRMTGYTTNIMDIPWQAGNYVVATNYITIQTLFANGITNPWVQLQMVTVNTVWPFNGWGNFSVQYYTNTIISYIAPDNRDPLTLGVNNSGD